MIDEKKYDPRSAHDWVPMVLVLIAFVSGAFVYIMPYLILVLTNDSESAQQKLGLILALPINETFNYLLVSLVSFWIGKNVSDKLNKP